MESSSTKQNIYILYKYKNYKAIAEMKWNSNVFYHHTILKNYSKVRRQGGWEVKGQQVE